MNGRKSILADELASELSIFKTDWELHSGLAMEALWASLKPPTATSIEQLETCLEIEELADRFDILRWHFGASIPELGKIRDSLLGVHTSVNRHDILTIKALEKTKKTLRDAEQQTHPFECSTGPFFRAQFEKLTEFRFLEKDGTTENRHEELEMLAGKSTKASMALGLSSPGWSALSQVHHLTVGSHKGSDMALVRQTFPISLLHRLSELNEAPLGSLSLLISEIDLISERTSKMCNIIGDDPLAHMDRKLMALRSMVAQAFAARSRAPEFNKYKPQIDALCTRLVGTNVMEKSTSNEAQAALLKCSAGIFSTCPSRSESHSDRTMMQLARDWMQFFAGLLLLYVPDRSFDPALQWLVKQDRHEKRLIERQSKLDALRTFEYSFSGQDSSYRIHLLQEDLKSLGTKPKAPAVLRPAISSLNLLQGEFNNILKSIVLRLPDMCTLEMTVGVNVELQERLNLLRVNIENAILRLSSNFRAYDDITKPVIAMLHGLNVGFSLVVFANAQKTKTEDAITHICNMTPLMRASPQSMQSQSFHDLERISLSGFDPRSLFLESIALAKELGLDLLKERMFAMLETFHSFYREWKEKLDHDQKENAARSSLYRYRGVEVDNQEFGLEDPLQIFQTNETQSDNIITMGTLNQDPKLRAQHLSHLHHEIFAGSKTTSSKILQMIHNASNQIAKMWSGCSQTSSSPVPAQDLLPALIVNLNRAKHSLQHQSKGQRLYNFYTDANIVEAQNIVALAKKIQFRFCELQAAWPEHAILEDVLRTSKELLLLRHSEPVAKILTKAEQLHSFIHEWQVVASREFTAINLYEQLTDLLVSWRRLELLTWGRLLDMEDKLCKDDSDAWWFIAYEVIIAVPMSLIDSQESVVAYAQQLYDTLREFLATTSIGQYVNRLNLLKCFEGHVSLLAKEHDSLNSIRNSLANFLRHHHRFSDPIQETLKVGREKLEKDLKEVLLLASWKDTNIIALRDSAKRSHHKLFKLVRKYRALLAQPAEDQLRTGLADPRQKIGVGDSADSCALIARTDFRALELCQQKVKDWNHKSARLRNPDVIVKTMFELIQLPPTAFDAAAYLNTFTSDLAENIRTLQKETPTNLTRENEVATRHLKSRKRKLFSETVKAVRQMGFRSNLSVDILEKQGTTAAVLSSTPAFGDTAGNDLAHADHYLDLILHIMPQTRENAIKHSEDITHGEASRAVGYLESILSTIMKQRKILARSVEDMAAFERICAQMTTLWAPGRYVIRQQDLTSERSEKEVYRVVQWLPNILDAGCIVVESHQKLSECNSSLALESLRYWQRTLSESRDKIAELPKLPDGISSTQHIETLTRSQSKVKALQDQLQRMEFDYPKLAFIFKQIQTWTRPCKADLNHNPTVSRIATLANVEISISNAVDSLLVALQHVSKALESAPAIDEEARWLFKADSFLTNSLRCLQSQEIEQRLKLAIADIKHLDSIESDTLELASAICALSLPIVQQYQQVQRIALARYSKLHLSLCRLATVLARSFAQVAQQGFCSPQEGSTSLDDSNEKLEGGTGLGEGQGTEDISKDVQDDEDLSELAQQGKKEEGQEELENEDDAMSMDYNEMMGEIGEMSDKSDGENASEGGDENDIDDEIGDVDDLDPGAVDEKLWDGRSGENEREREKEDGKARGEADKDQVQATDIDGTEVGGGEAGDEDERDGQDEHSIMNEDGADENEGMAQEETEKMDSNVQEGQNLDFPEELNLDDEHGSQCSPSEDDKIAKLSDIDDEEKSTSSMDHMAEDKDPDLPHQESAGKVEYEDSEELKEEADDGNEGRSAGSPVDTEPEDEDTHHENQEGLLQNRTYEAGPEMNDMAPSDVQGLGQDMESTQDVDQIQDNAAQASKGAEGRSDEPEDAQAAAVNGRISEVSADNWQVLAQDEGSGQEQTSQPFKKLGDALEEWLQQQRQIQDASSPNRKPQPTRESQNPQNEEFQHLGPDEQEADTQVLGPAASEQARPLNDREDDVEKEELATFDLGSNDAEGVAEEDQVMDDAEDLEKNSKEFEEKLQATGPVSKHVRSDPQAHPPGADKLQDLAESMNKLDNDLSLTHLLPSKEASMRSLQDAQQLWFHYEAITRDLSLFLTEQLRLILAPTQATKMRGDFRTGKRLNIKRIIPYIASNFKRDKIWMRRSIPSKRNYQIMLAVDDSKSMSESGSGHLAYQTLALVAKSLSMLDVGEICILGFGNDMFVAHSFDHPFSSGAGANVLQRFSFHQEGTNVAKLVDQSIRLFREARSKRLNTGQDLWQLELIISDGLCEDHEIIKRLVRQATEERIMIVFVIVDALLQGHSIIDMNQAIFEFDPAAEETGFKMKRYLDGFPFTYYLVVGDVRELPRVLAQALRQWFAETVES